LQKLLYTHLAVGGNCWTYWSFMEDSSELFHVKLLPQCMQMVLFH